MSATTTTEYTYKTIKKTDRTLKYQKTKRTVGKWEGLPDYMRSWYEERDRNFELQFEQNQARKRAGDKILDSILWTRINRRQKRERRRYTSAELKYVKQEERDKFLNEIKRKWLERKPKTFRDFVWEHIWKSYDKNPHTSVWSLQNNKHPDSEKYEFSYLIYDYSIQEREMYNELYAECVKEYGKPVAGNSRIIWEKTLLRKREWENREDFKNIILTIFTEEVDKSS